MRQKHQKSCVLRHGLGLYNWLWLIVRHLYLSLTVCEDGQMKDWCACSCSLCSESAHSSLIYWVPNTNNYSFTLHCDNWNQWHLNDHDLKCQYIQSHIRPTPTVVLKLYLYLFCAAGLSAHVWQQKWKTGSMDENWKLCCYQTAYIVFLHPNSIFMSSWLIVDILLNVNLFILRK